MTRLCLLLAVVAPAGGCAATPPPPVENVFRERRYEPAPLPGFEATRGLLPSPVYDARPEWVAMYWRAWEIAFRNFHAPAPGSGFVSPFIDAAFSENIYLWDTCFLSMFCNYAHPLVPGIGSLDNFYAKQHPDGEICREIVRATGQDLALWVNEDRQPLFSRWGWHVFQPGKGMRARQLRPVTYRGRAAPAKPPALTLDALNHPILGWAERESFQVTGDRARLQAVFPILVRYYRALQTHLRQGNGLYITDWASMDDSPRNPLLDGGGTGIDISCEMALFARDLAAIAGVLGETEAARRFERDAAELSALINRLMWDPERRFYFDLTLEGERTRIKTIAAYWALLAGVASPEQARHLVEELDNPATFRRLHRVPTVAADEPGYRPVGYWRGGVWAPTDAMVVRGLERCGQPELAREIALNHLEMVGRVFAETGTFWENYAADAASPGSPSRRDFVGWSGLGPIMFLLEHAVGLKPDAPRNELRWVLRGDRRLGCERFRFNGHVATLAATPAADARFRVEVVSDGDFTLRVEREGAAEVRRVRKGERLEFLF